MKDYGLTFVGELKRRRETLYHILHHSASHDVPVTEIHRWHLNRGWAGVGYNFLIRADGTIEIGRPIWAQGAHAGEKANPVSVGTCLTGFLTHHRPTTAQLSSLNKLHSYLLTIYPGIKPREHREFMSTSCPGLLRKEDIMAIPDWKRYGFNWLKEMQIITGGEWQPDSPLDLGTLGAVLSRLQFEGNVKIKKREV